MTKILLVRLCMFHQHVGFGSCLAYYFFKNKNPRKVYPIPTKNNNTFSKTQRNMYPFPTKTNILHFICPIPINVITFRMSHCPIPINVITFRLSGQPRRTPGGRSASSKNNPGNTTAPGRCSGPRGEKIDNENIGSGQNRQW